LREVEGVERFKGLEVERFKSLGVELAKQGLGVV